MKFKSKTKATLLSIVAASTLAIPGVAMANVTYGTGDYGANPSTASEATSAVVTTQLTDFTDDEATLVTTDGISQAVYDLTSANQLESVLVAGVVLPAGADGVVVELSPTYTGVVTLTGAALDDKTLIRVDGVEYTGETGAPKILTFVQGVPAGNYDVDPDSVQELLTRLGGQDRYETMAYLNTSVGGTFDTTFPENGGTIVVASGAKFADALSASALAGAYNTGIITTDPTGLADTTLAMLSGMDTRNMAYIVGGEASVSESVSQQLEALGFSVSRLAGADRNETAVKVKTAVVGLNAGQRTAIIASGVSFADALSIAPYAYTQHMPILLTDAEGNLGSATGALFDKNLTNFDSVIIVGGTSVVSQEAQDILESYGMGVTRLAGENRYASNTIISMWMNETSDTNKFEGSNVYVASGQSFADALAAAPVAGISNGTIALVGSGSYGAVSVAVEAGANPVVVGGSSAVDDTTAGLINELLAGLTAGDGF